MIKKISTTLLFIAIAFIGFAQTINKAKLDSFFHELETRNKFMGSVAVIKDGEIVYTNAIGFSDVEGKVKPNKETKYRVGSITKSFTATLIFKAIEEGKLALTTTLDKFYPTVPNAAKISISDLLDHRSGIHNFTDDMEYQTYLSDKKSEKDMLAIIEKGGSDFEPGSKASYSNSNYVLLSYILQKLYQSSYADLLNKMIIKPLGLKNTYVGSRIDIKNNETHSYRYSTRWEDETETDMSIPMGAGAIVSTPGDLLRFADALLNVKIVSSQSVEQMKTLKDRYGYGLVQFPFGASKGYGHTGGIDGFKSVYAYFPNEKIGMAITSNGNNMKMNDISIVLLSAAFDVPFKLPTYSNYTVTATELNAYTGNYSSTEIPLNITVTTTGGRLMAQATGQSSFELEATGKDKFKFDPAGIVVEFIPAEKNMVMKQGGKVYHYSKE